MLEIENRGPELVRTNFWDSDLATKGGFYLSWNAGVGRLLVSDARAADLADMQAARMVIVSDGPWPAHGGRRGLELLFEDDGDSPYCVHMPVAEQSDRALPETEQGREFEIVAYTRAGQQHRWVAQYRRVSSIPHLQPWEPAPEAS